MSRTWFITGSAGGLGAGIACAALQAGDSVVATDLDLQRLQAIYTGDAAHADRVLCAELDIRNEAQARDVVAAAVARFGRIDVVVNNAGYGLFGAFEENDAASIERQFAVNVHGTFNVTRAVLPQLRRQRAGHVINMSSNGGIRGVRGASMYSASKFAIEGFSESLAEELAEFGIRVTLVEPGAFRTGFLATDKLQQGPIRIADYDAFRAAAQAVFAARHRHQRGDPRKLGQALLALVAHEQPPLRFVAGADALQVVDQKLAQVASDVKRWRSLSSSTDFAALTRE